MTCEAQVLSRSPVKLIYQAREKSVLLVSLFCGDSRMSRKYL